MKKNAIILCIIFIISIGIFGVPLLINNKKNIAELPAKEEIPVKNSVSPQNVKENYKIHKTEIQKETIKNVKKTNLYNDNYLIPLSAIVDISSLPEQTQNSINSIIENANLYYLKKHNDNVFLIIGNFNNEKYQRHDIQLVEINKNGNKKITELNNTEEHANDNDEWEYDKISNLPIKHTKYNSKGEIEFVEIWNYSQNEPIKYELRDGNDKVLSIKKETYDNDSNMRVEHLIYDESGDTKINISANYEGPNITRFTYFNSEKPHDSVTLMSDFEDGTKTKETIYSSNYKVKNSFNAEYKDGERINIKKYDAENNLVEEIVSED